MMTETEIEEHKERETTFYVSSNLRMRKIIGDANHNEQNEAILCFVLPFIVCIFFQMKFENNSKLA